MSDIRYVLVHYSRTCYVIESGANNTSSNFSLKLKLTTTTKENRKEKMKKKKNNTDPYVVMPLLDDVIHHSVRMRLRLLQRNGTERDFLQLNKT